VVNIVLIDDDEEDIVLLLTQFLSKYGYRVDYKTYNGRKVVSISKEFREYPDIILLDYQMPLVDGLKVIKDYLGLHPEYNILLLATEPSVKHRALKASIKYFYEKEVNFKQLENVIEDIISKSNNTLKFGHLSRNINSLSQ